jgi:hypothetical protein
MVNKMVNLTMPAILWEAVLASLDLEVRAQLLDRVSMAPHASTAQVKDASLRHSSPADLTQHLEDLLRERRVRNGKPRA